MSDADRPTVQRSDLPRIVRQVRQRWRMKLALRGLTSVIGIGVVLLLAAAVGLEWARFSPTSIVTSRIGLGVALLALVGYFLVRPLLRRVTDEQVALYLEEHEPALEAAIISAVEASKRPAGANRAALDDSRSPALIERLVESAIETCMHTGAASRVEQARLVRYAAAAAVVVLLGLATFVVGPGYLRQALSALLRFTSSVEAAAPYRIEVAPGHATLPKGADQAVTAKLHGFDAETASLMVRRAADGEFEPLPLIRAENGQYEGILFDLGGPVDYRVEAGGVVSPLFTLKVIDLPYVQQLELEYVYPAYTGLEPQTIENGGDVAVLAGTQVRVRVTPTMKTPGGRIALNDKETVALQAGADGKLTGAFTASRDGFYRIELDAPTGERVAASPQYTIDVLADQPPHVSFAKPGRDTTASPIEEVFVEATAEDDFGVRDLDLVYSVNGGEEKTIKLFGGSSRLPEVSAGHTFYLEELGVQAGDAVSYYARAADNDNKGGKRAISDLYFVRVRPFKKDFRQAQSMGGGGGGMGGMGGGQADALSEQQRQIIAATFNVQRDRKALSSDKLKEHTVVVGLSQSRLREQVEGLVTRMNSRLVEQDPSFKKIAELLPKAIAEMKAAEGKLSAVSPDGALPPEHRALGFLQKAEEEYELQVSTSREAGGGGGGAGRSQMAEELAGLFELELDRMANQYETADRAMQQNTDQQLDALLEKLKELARRQEQEAERQRRLSALGQAASGGGAQQRALAEQAEEAARRLERLSREENRPELMDSARRLQEVADQMRRAAASGDKGAAAQAAAALDRLRETERRLQRSQSDRVERDVRDAQRRAEELARDQRDIAEDARDLPTRTGESRRQLVGQLSERKTELASEIGDLEKQLDRSAADASRDQRDAARRMSEAANTIRDQRLRDRLRYSQAMLGRSTRETQDSMEREIASGLDAVRRKLDEAAAALGKSKPGEDKLENALDRARRLARGVESLGQRTRERMEGQQAGQSQQQGQQGQRGQQGQQSQSGQQGQQGQGGQQGQSGQQGQGDQEGQGGQPGNGSDSAQASGAAGGYGDTRGGFVNGGGWGDRRWDGLGPEEVRQFRGEIRQWTGEAQALRQELREQNIDPKELDELLRALRQLDDDRVYRNASELERLQTFVTEGLKRLEFGLRRRADEDAGSVVLSSGDEVPETFRSMVEQYYRSLSKK